MVLVDMVLQNYYGIAIRSPVGNLEAMKILHMEESAYALS